MMEHFHPTHEELEAVDVMPHEVRHLNELQSAEEFTPHGYYMYRTLGSHLNHPHVHEYLSQESHHRRHAAMGGAMPTHMAEGGDAMQHEPLHTVYMPRHMTHLLDHMTGGPHINPHTGRRHYFLGSLVGSLRNAVSNFAPRAGKFFSGIGNTLRGLIPNQAQAGQYARNAANQLGQHAVSTAGQFVGLPEDQRNIAGLAGAAGRMASGALNSGIEHVRSAVQDPNFSFNRQNVGNVARGAFGAAKDYTANQVTNALNTPMHEMHQGADPYSGNGYAAQFGNLGHQIGGNAGAQFGGQAGNYVGGMTNRMAANPEMAAGMQGRTNIYGRNTGRQLGSAIAGRAGHMLGNAFDNMGGYLSQRFRPTVHPELQHGFSPDLFA